MKRWETLIATVLASLWTLAHHMEAVRAAQTPFEASRSQSAAPGTETSPANQPISVFSAIMVDPEQAPQRSKSVTVRVTVSGLRLVDAEDASGQPRPGEGHLHYRIDNGPVIATKTPQLAFHELAPGTHVITVQLVDSAHRPLGPLQTLSAHIP